MRKSIFGICICVILTVFIACDHSNSTPAETHIIDSVKLIEFSDAEAVYNNSELVVRVEKVSEEPIAYSPGEGHYDRFTLSSVKILNVINQREDFTYKIGDVIRILESEWSDDEGVIHHTSHYLKMTKGKIYTLYLGYNSEVDNFYPTGLLYGKIPEDENEAVFYGDFESEEIIGIVNELRNRAFEN